MLKRIIEPLIEAALKDVGIHFGSILASKTHQEMNLKINETLNTSNNNTLGIGNHQTRIRAGIVKRKPINKNGGKYSIAGFAITKPKPKNIGTKDAIRVSFIFISSF